MGKKILKQIGTGRTYGFNPQLAKRKDMRLFTVNDDGEIEDGEGRVAGESVPRAQTEALMQANKRLMDLEQQYSYLVKWIVANVENGEDFMKDRDTLEGVEIPEGSVTLAQAMTVTDPRTASAPLTPSVGPTGGELAPGSKSTDGTSIGNSTVANLPQGTQDQEALDQAAEKVESARVKVKQQQDYFDERTQLAEESRSEVADAQSAVETADDDGRAAAEESLKDKQADLKGFEIKEKSATTKLGNAEKALTEAEEELAKLLPDQE